MSKVKYRLIPRYKFYRVGTDGSVWTQRYSLKVVNGEIERKVVWIRLKDRPGTRYGHRYVSLRKGRKSYREWVHRLVLEAFVGPCPEGMECRHFPDRNPANNNLSNLQWGTHKENSDDMVFHGTNIGPKGLNHPGAKLTEADVLKMRRLRQETGLTYQEIGSIFNVSSMTASKAIKGITYKEVK